VDECVCVCVCVCVGVCVFVYGCGMYMSSMHACMCMRYICVRYWQDFLTDEFLAKRYDCF